MKKTIQYPASKFMKPGDDVKIIKSEEPYHIGITARIIEIREDEIRLSLQTGKPVTYKLHACKLEVIQTKEQRDVAFRDSESNRTGYARPQHSET